jgi:hypothetical protein
VTATIAVYVVILTAVFLRRHPRAQRRIPVFRLCRCLFFAVARSSSHLERSIFLRRHPERSEGSLHSAFAVARFRIGVIDANRR